MSARLTSVDDLHDTALRPAYDRDAHGPGIVHIGLGAFHKAHQAVYTDDALAASGGDWRITGVSLRSATPAEELAPQDGLYTVIERSAEGTKARVIGAMAAAYGLTTDRQAVLEALVAPATRIVSITVTEKGYGIDRATGGIDRAHPAIAADLADPDNPQGLAGLLVWALGQRRAAGVPPFTVLSCDNLPENGPLMRGLLVDFARHTAPDMVDFIAGEVAFPATMVDRITPARGAGTLSLAKDLIGHRDEAAIECEAFRQWVVEDHFPTGRPNWDEAGGAMFVEDVRPYEAMKLQHAERQPLHPRLCGVSRRACPYVRDVMADPAACSPGPPAPRCRLRPRFRTCCRAIDLVRLCPRNWTARFRQPGDLGHETFQIAMDGTEKMPQRIFAPAVDALERDLPLEAFAFATAAWMRYTLGKTDTGEAFALRDPREAELTALNGVESARDIVTRLLALPGFCPAPLRDSAPWRQAVTGLLDLMLAEGVQAAILKAAARRPC